MAAMREACLAIFVVTMAVMREVCLEIFVVMRAEISEIAEAHEISDVMTIEVPETSDVMTIEAPEIFVVMTTGVPEISAVMKVEEMTGVEHHVDKRESEIVGDPERPRETVVLETVVLETAGEIVEEVTTELQEMLAHETTGVVVTGHQLETDLAAEEEVVGGTDAVTMQVAHQEQITAGEVVLNLSLLGDVVAHQTVMTAEMTEE